MSPQDPIGIFDSGTGGLTVAKAVKAQLPNERIIYFGDSAHLPYGDKSTATIQAYAIKITDILLQRKCKVILIACNSASAAAFELIKEYTGSKALVVNVIDPVVQYVKEQYDSSSVGLIGTLQTVNSKVFENKLLGNRSNTQLKSMPTPLLVPMIEEGFVRNVISRDIISNYLNAEMLQDIQALILGCTHYPIIKEEIAQFYGDERVELIDSALMVAEALKNKLEARDLLNLQKSNAPKDKFLFSDLTEGFKNAAQLFFGQEIEFEKYPLWE